MKPTSHNFVQNLKGSTKNSYSTVYDNMQFHISSKDTRFLLDA